MTSQTTSAHCRDPEGNVSDSVSLSLFGHGLRLAWPPITAAIGLTWWAIALVRRGRAEGTVDPSAVPNPAGPTPEHAGEAADTADVEASLRQLQLLLDRGLLSREEYQARRDAVLKRAFG